MLAALIILFGWILGVGLLGTTGIYGNGYIWGDGWSFADGDDVMFVIYVVVAVLLALNAARAIAREF